MFSSLRSRLWLTYILVIGLMLAVVGSFLVLYLARNPVALRQAEARFRLAEETITNRAETPAGLSRDRMQQIANREDRVLGIRILILGSDGTVQVDSRKNSAADFPPFSLPIRVTVENANPPPVIRDVNGGLWWYALRPLNQDAYLMVSTPRPRVVLRALLGDELVGLILRAGGLATLLALLLGLAMEWWISSPLRRITHAAGEMASGLYRPIPEEGPREVQDLARAFNDMAHKVQITQGSQRDFVANVSHELKTPLTSIQGFAQAILDGAVSQPETLHQAANVIYDEAGRMYRMVLDLLALARLDAGTADLQKAPLDLAALLRGVTEKLSPQAQQGQVTLRSQVERLPAFVGDGDRLAQVFTNLVDNALKFSPRGGSVTIFATVNEGWIDVRVKDSGPGIPAEASERVFERFYQIDPARKGGSGRGSGLGLAIAKEIVVAHGGTIGVDSRPGEGSTFWVRLPAVRPGESAFPPRRGKDKR